MRVVLTGGSGYIGMHAIQALLRAGHEVVALDLRKPTRPDAVPGAVFVQGDVTDLKAVSRFFETETFDAVVHIAGRKSVAESMQHPALYFHHNTIGTLRVLQAMVDAGVRDIVFSSSASVYGSPDSVPVTEDAIPRPESPYGASKLMAEQLFPWFERAHGVRWLSFRYFNVAGAAFDGTIGEEPETPTNLIPAALEAVTNEAAPLAIFGTDHATPDGTAVRDYIHVVDLAEAHVRGLSYLADGGGPTVLNLGTGHGSSVREVLMTLGRAAGVEVPSYITDRRPGDPSSVWADSSRAARVLGWKPRLGLPEIVETAWRWHARGRGSS